MDPPGLLEKLNSQPPQAVWPHTPKAALGQLPEPVAMGDRAGAGPAVVQAQHPIPSRHGVLSTLPEGVPPPQAMAHVCDTGPELAATDATPSTSTHHFIIDFVEMNFTDFFHHIFIFESYEAKSYLIKTQKGEGEGKH